MRSAGCLTDLYCVITNCANIDNVVDERFIVVIVPDTVRF
jgi:hypothetical protein